MHWLTLLPCLVSCAVGATLTYRREWADEWWFLPAFALLSVASGLLYGVGVRCCRDDAEAFVFSLVWDVTVTVVYVVVPLVWCGVRLTPFGWVGLVAVAVGLILLKAVGTAKTP
jgi:multidrug transporter EmrE-like cation transporter